MVKQQHYKAALYCRLSVDDGNFGGSVSIETQKVLLEQYCKDHSITDYTFYCDDGCSGTNFDREAFQKMNGDIRSGKINLVIVKDLSRFGRNYVETGMYVREFTDNNIRFIAADDNYDSLVNGDDLLFPIKNVVNEMYARDCSKKIKAVFKSKGQSGKPLATHIPYGYMKSEADKNVWMVDEETAPVVKRIYRLCIDGYGPMQIAKILTADSILTPTAYRQLKSTGSVTVEKTCRWAQKTIVGILEKLEYVGHTVNFKTRRKSYMHKMKLDNPRKEWLIFENTHEPIFSQHVFDLVQKMRKNKRKIQKCGEVNPFSGIVYCADCGAKMYLCRSRSMTDEQEHMKCSTYSNDPDECSAHFIRTVVLRELVLGELNKLLETVHANGDEFVNTAMEYASTAQSQEVKKARKILTQSEKRIAELDKLFTRLYEDNVSGKISDERFAQMSANYDGEQQQLKQTVSKLKAFIEATEQKTADISNFIWLVRKYT